MPNVTITNLTAATGAAPAALEIPAYNSADAGTKTRKWTLATLLAALTAPNFTTLQIASGASASAMLAIQGSVAVTDLAAGAEEDVTVAATGALVDDHVILTPRAAPAAGLVYQAWVSLADTITVRVTNTGASPATATLLASLLIVRAS